MSALAEARADLVTLLSGARFLAELRLIEVTGHRWDTLSDGGMLRYRSLMGDHSVVPTATMT